jgi:putative Holliday junction resolvase
VDLIVVGLPVGLRGEEGAQAGIVRGFRDEVANLVEVPVETYDERLTTKLAERTARSGASAAEDSIAAAHILESYLQSREGSG